MDEEWTPLHTRTKNDLSRYGPYSVVPWGEAKISSDRTLASFRYATCSGIVLLDGTQAALFHLYRAEDAPELLDSIVPQLGPSLEAVLKPSSSSEETELRWTLERYNIPIADLYLSPRWRSGRDMIAIPKKQEVRIYDSSNMMSVFRKESSRT